jgi:hypothetical protein
MGKRTGTFVMAAIIVGCAVFELEAQTLPEQTADRRRIAGDVHQSKG